MKKYIILVLLFLISSCDTINKAIPKTSLCDQGYCIDADKICHCYDSDIKLDKNHGEVNVSVLFPSPSSSKSDYKTKSDSVDNSEYGQVEIIIK